MTVETLLPSSATPLERAFSLAAAEQPRPPVELLTRLYDPLTCPETILPYLAWAFSVDLWKEDWPVEKKRAVVAAAPVLHRLKGTKAGLDRHLGIVDVKLKRLIQPPDRFVPDPSMTKAEREAYLSRFRQIRVYPFRSRGMASHQAYVGSGLRLRGLFPGVGGGFFPAVSDAIVRIGRRAFVYDPLTDIEEPILRLERETVEMTGEAVAFEQFSLPGKAGYGFFAGRAAVRMFSVDAGAASRLFSMTIRKNYDWRADVLHLTAVTPSATPIDVRPRKAAVKGQRGYGQLFPRLGGRAAFFVGRAGDGIYRIFLPPTTAGIRIYDQVFLNDPDRRPDRRHARTFLGAVRLGMPAHNQRAVVEARGRRPKRAFGAWVNGFIVEATRTRFNDAIEAALVSKAAYEKTLLTAKTMRPVSVADGISVGRGIAVGTWIKDF